MFYEPFEARTGKLYAVETADCRLQPLPARSVFDIAGVIDVRNDRRPPYALKLNMPGIE